MSADMLTDLVDLLIIILINIDQDLVNILTDSEQTYRPMGAFSTQGTRNLSLNALSVCSQL